VGITTIVRIERGEIEEPRVSTLRKLAEALVVEPRDLLAD
jgi:transcriptional regulator with XRE-family HTH domain